MQGLTPKGLRLLTGGLILCVPFGLFGAYHGLGWFKDTTRLNHVISQIETEDPGWRIQELEDHRATISDDQNGALQVKAAAELLPRPLPLDHAWNDLENNPILLQLDQKQKTRLHAQMQQDAEALAEARKLADLPRGRFPITWARDAHEHNPPHMQMPRDVIWLLKFDLMQRAADGDLDGALLSFRAAWNAARSFGDEPYLPSQRERLQCRGIALSNLERVLGQGQPSSQAMLGLIPCLLEEDREPIVLIAWRGERAMLYELMEAYHAGQMKDDIRFELSRRDVETRTLDFLTRIIEAAKLSSAEQLPRMQAILSELVGGMGDNPGLPDVDAKINVQNALNFRTAFLRQQARLRCMVLALAAEHYRQTHHGRWPARLDELAPDPLHELPADPFDGNPMRYSIQDQSIVIYSIGTDLVDDGGRIDHPNPFLRTDIGVRLWNADLRHLKPGAKVPQPIFPQ